MKIPYGVADFYSLRTEGQLYVDRTDRIPVLEELGKAMLFLRPRRFGKSLWLSVLANYYDLRTAGEHESLFGGLAMGDHPPGESAGGAYRGPTPLAHRYFILRWDFSRINPDPPPWGVNAKVESRHERIGNEINGYLNTMIDVFQRDYREHLPEIIELREDPFHNLEQLLSVIRRTPYRLYLLIDEYDNFANEILANDEDAYKDLVHSDGPFKYLFKWVKGLMAGAGLERLFITGVSPLVMSDITSGMNIADNVYLIPELNTLCGFTDEEVQGLLGQLHAERTAKATRSGMAAPSWPVDDARTMLRDWYNGYRFTPTARAGDAAAVYNPTLVLYFLNHLQRYDAYPDQMLDANLAADEGKLDYLAQVAAGQDAVVDMIRKEKPLEVTLLLDRFRLADLLELSAQDVSFLGAYLYYFGMVTLAGQTSRRTWLLETPNEVVRGLYVERIRRLLLPLGADRTAAMEPAWDLMEGKEIEPLLDFIERTLFPTFSNRDATWANELTVKTIFLTLLWNVASYITHSEPELDHRYADLCLLRRPDARASSLWDLLFEFKRLSLNKLGMSGEDVKKTPRAELMALGQVTDALDQAEAQLVAYRKALARRQGDVLKLRAYAVVALGFERLVVRPLPPL
ncbi:MAG: AAA family ATPase [bacterium]|nr:AAA family ATPase [bacterium]